MEQADKEALMQSLHKLKRTQAWYPTLSGISRGEFFMLHRIASLSKQASEEKPGVKITELSVAAEMSKPAVSQMLNSLEDKEFVERVTTKTDRRVVYVRLTETGKAKLKEHAAEMGRKMDLIIKELGPEDTAQLTRLIDKLRIALEKNEGS